MIKFVIHSVLKDTFTQNSFLLMMTESCVNTERREPRDPKLIFSQFSF